MSQPHGASDGLAISQSFGMARECGFFERLGEIYALLPATNCRRCNTCCGLLPPVAPIEALAWLGRLVSLPRREALEEARALLRHFLSNAALRLPCPYLGEGGCSIYESRFFACRAYGLWPASSYGPKAVAAAAAANQVALAWQGLGVELPREVTAPAPPYCWHVGPAEGPGPSAGELTALEDELHQLGEGLPGVAALAAFGGDLSYLVAARSQGQGRALADKVTTTRKLMARRESGKFTLSEAQKEALAEWFCYSSV